jgi:hypothetical protein
MESDDVKVYELVETPKEPTIDDWQQLAARMHAARMPFAAMCELVLAFEDGVKKHGAGLWGQYELGRQSVLRDKATRHFSEVVRGGFGAIDMESGILHAAKEAANMLIGAQIWGKK